MTDIGQSTIEISFELQEQMKPPCEFVFAQVQSCPKSATHILTHRCSNCDLVAQALVCWDHASRIVVAARQSRTHCLVCNGEGCVAVESVVSL